jgi:hypothetical protein
MRGTNIEQDGRWGDKNKKLKGKIKFPKCFDTKVSMNKVNMEVMRAWVTKRMADFLEGTDDDVPTALCINLLEASKVLLFFFFILFSAFWMRSFCVSCFSQSHAFVESTRTAKPHSVSHSERPVNIQNFSFVFSSYFLFFSSFQSFRRPTHATFKFNSQAFSSTTRARFARSFGTSS